MVDRGTDEERDLEAEHDREIVVEEIQQAHDDSAVRDVLDDPDADFLTRQIARRALRNPQCPPAWDAPSIERIRYLSQQDDGSLSIDTDCIDPIRSIEAGTREHSCTTTS